MAEVERVVTHKTIASVARLMGYTPNGIRELLESCEVKKAPLLISEGTHWLTEWVVIGITRRRTNQGIERVSARFNFRTRKFEFSSGSEAFALTPNERERQRLREEVASEAVRLINRDRPQVRESFIRENLDRQAPPTQEAIMGSGSSERASEKIISPVAPRDPRGLNAAQRWLSGPGSSKSEG